MEQVGKLVVALSVGAALLVAGTGSCADERQKSGSNVGQVKGSNHPQVHQDKESLEIRKLLSARDFSADLAKADVCMDDASDPVTGPFAAAYDKLDIPEAYSRGERMLLEGWRTSRGMHMNLAAALDLIRGFHQYHNRLPQDGAELVAWVETSRAGTTSARIREALASDEVLERFGYAVNPVTGKVLQSFGVDQWSPGGVYVKLIETPEELKVAFAGRPGYSACLGSDFVEAWLVKVYGEAEGVVLGSKPIVFFRPGPEPQQGMRMDISPNSQSMPQNPCAAHGD